MLTNLKRVFHFAITDLYRNYGISLAAIFILTITVLLTTSLFFIHGASNFLVDTIQNKIDVTAYFKEDTSEQDILNVQKAITNLSPDVARVEYVSKEQALEAFTERYKDNPAFANALKEVGDNPFLPSLNITTRDNANLYEDISHLLESDTYSALVSKIDFAQKRDTIQKVFAITSSINKIGFVIGIILILISLGVVFNTIKMAIDSSKEEISTMNIVGASDWFIKAPFVIEGALFGAIAFVIGFIITIVVVFLTSRGVQLIMPGFSLSSYTFSHLWLLILIQLASGVGLGALFSFIAVKRYLK